MFSILQLMSAQINVVSDDHAKTSKNNIFKYYIFKYIFKHKNINFNIYLRCAFGKVS